MKTLVMTFVAAGAAAGAAPAMAQYGYHDDSAHHRYAPASYGMTYGVSARPYAARSYGSLAGSGGHYDFAGDHFDYDPSPVHGMGRGTGYGLARPAVSYTPSYGGYGSGYGYSAPAYRPASTWGHSDADHHVYGW